MNRRIRSGLWFLAIGLIACGGGTAPTISDLALSSTTVAPGGSISGTLKISDPDGLAGMSVTLSVSGPAQASATTPVQGASDSMTEASIPFTLMLSAAAPLGTYSFTVTATDGDSNTSNALTGSVTIK